ncbi:MAG: hypothetical protein WD271_17640 [Acidimicrobiia bacterium]
MMQEGTNQATRTRRSRRLLAALGVLVLSAGLVGGVLAASSDDDTPADHKPADHKPADHKPADHKSVKSVDPTSPNPDPPATTSAPTVVSVNPGPVGTSNADDQSTPGEEFGHGTGHEGDTSLGSPPPPTPPPTPPVDTAGPTIDLVYWDHVAIYESRPYTSNCPSMPTAITDATLYVHVSDPSGIAGVDVRYEVFGATFVRPMALSGDTFTKNLGMPDPSFTDSSRIFLVEVIATDARGNETRFTVDTLVILDCP